MSRPPVGGLRPGGGTAGGVGDGDQTRRDEGREGAYIGEQRIVGVRIGQPDDARDAQPILKDAKGFEGCQARIAHRIENRGRKGEQRAASVGGETAAFQGQRRAEAAHFGKVQQRMRKIGIDLAAALAPAVERPVGGGSIPFAVDEERWARIAQAHVMCCERHDLIDSAAQGLARSALRTGCRQQADGLKSRCGFSDGGDGALQRWIKRPRQPQPRLARHIGGQIESVRSRNARGAEACGRHQYDLPSSSVVRRPSARVQLPIIRYCDSRYITSP